MYILHVGLFILVPSPLVVEFCSNLIIPYKYIIFILIYFVVHMFIFMIVIAYVGGWCLWYCPFWLLYICVEFWYWGTGQLHFVANCLNVLARFLVLPISTQIPSIISVVANQSFSMLTYKAVANIFDI